MSSGNGGFGTAGRRFAASLALQIQAKGDVNPHGTGLFFECSNAVAVQKSLNFNVYPINISGK